MTTKHPLDPLTTTEMARAVKTARTRLSLPQTARFANIELHEPDKAAVLAFSPGDAIVRQAFMVIFDTRTNETLELVVDLQAGEIARRTVVPVSDPPYGQPAVILEEFHTVASVCRADAGWRTALKRRGFSDADIELVWIDPFVAGNFGEEVSRGRRAINAVCYYRADAADCPYMHPVEGLVAVVDLIGKTVIELRDDHLDTPFPTKRYDYEKGTIATRTDQKALHITQPDGPSFTVDGWHVSWQKWRFRVGFTPREGLVLHQLGYDDGGRHRPIIYRASVDEMVVPYGDTGMSHYWKSAFDAGEVGLGKCANALELGCDCLGHIHYFDVPSTDDFGAPMLMKNAICMHEEDYGILWKHAEFRTGSSETRRSRRLVISFFATVGNYDYGFYWYLYQDGTIQLETKLTGIVQTAAVPDAAGYRGGMMGPGLGGPIHQHIFNARLHMHLDGQGNSVTEHEFVGQPWGEKNPYGNAFDLTTRVLTHEQEACRIADGASGRFWKIINPNQRNDAGNHPGYKLVATASPLLLAQPDSSVAKRAAFATHHLWVTPYAAAERFAAGMYINKSQGGEGLPKYIKQGRSIENTELVVWHSFGHTHFCKPEDLPVMPVEYAGFTLKPNNFFGRNPGIDVAPGKDGHSTSKGSCCPE